MPPLEPFQKCHSDRPSWRHATVTLSVEVGAHSVEALHQETGIEVGSLRTILAELEEQRYITRIDGRYRRPTNRGAMVPPSRAAEVQVDY